VRILEGGQLVGIAFDVSQQKESFNSYLHGKILGLQQQEVPQAEVSLF
jgi:hypothetical protein